MKTAGRYVSSLALAALATLTLAAGCDLASGGEESTLEGMFELTAWTTAPPDECDGTPVASPEGEGVTHFFLRTEEFLGATALSVVTCTDLASCRAMAADQGTFYVGTFSFNEGDDADGWTGSQITLSGTETCSGTVDETVLTGEAGVAVRIERVTKEVDAVPVDDEGRCDVDAALALAADAPCSLYTEVTGEFIEEI